MNGKTFFIDQTRCTACRGCQAACKQWKNLGFDRTRNTGSYQNPPDLNGHTFKLVRFNEMKHEGVLKWLFFPEQCRHCLEPPCKMAADVFVEGAIIQDPATGAVLYTEKTKQLDYKIIRESCPYDIPRYEADTGHLTKCNMCIDRVRNGMLPACVKTCPTDTMHFGERDEMMALAQKRLAEVQKRTPSALLADYEFLRVLFLCEMPPKYYHAYMVAESNETKPLDNIIHMARLDRRQLLGLSGEKS